MPPFNTRQRLGKKTFWLFLIRNGVGAIIFFALTLIFFILASIGVSFEAMEAFFILGLLISAFLFVVLGAIAFAWTWYEYKNYTFILDEHALEVSRGIITKENISIPYHHIEDINLEQSLFYQMIGVCRLVIMTAGHSEGDEEAEGILPAIDLNEGREIQRIIMARSNIQEVVNVQADSANANNLK